MGFEDWAIPYTKQFIGSYPALGPFILQSIGAWPEAGPFTLQLISYGRMHFAV
jgi:hypothetical protein